MDFHHHTQEIEKLPDINFTSIDLDKMNPLEQLGLYLIGQISRGRLSELWRTKKFITSSEIVSTVWDAIEPLWEEKK